MMMMACLVRLFADALTCYAILLSSEFRSRMKNLEQLVVEEGNMSSLVSCQRSICLKSSVLFKQEKLDDVSPIASARHHPHCSPEVLQGMHGRAICSAQGLPDPEGFLLHLIVTAMNGDDDDEPTIGGMNCLRQDL